MGNKQLSPPLIAGIIVVAILVVGLLGWHFINGPRTGPGGIDLSKAGVQPSSAAGNYKK